MDRVKVVGLERPPVHRILDEEKGFDDETVRLCPGFLYPPNHVQAIHLV